MERKSYVQGLIMVASANVIWGVLPLYWRLVNAVSPFLLFGHRVVWCFLILVMILSMQGRLRALITTMRDRKMWKPIIGSGVCLGFYWLTYMYAVNNGYVIEMSLGYFVNPLIITIFGTIFFKEKLTRFQIIGFVLAGIGVLIKSIYYQRIPIFGLALAIFFALYGVCKKKSSLDSMSQVALEMLIIGIPSMVYMLFIEANGEGLAGNLPWFYWLIMPTTGVVTAAPLLLYGGGNKRLPLTAIGFLQYIAPILILVLGIVVFKEPFEMGDLIPFSLIWLGLIFFIYSQYRLLSKAKVKADAA